MHLHWKQWILTQNCSVASVQEMRHAPLRAKLNTTSIEVYGDGSKQVFRSFAAKETEIYSKNARWVFCLFSVAWKKKMRPWKASSYTVLPAKACAIH